MQTSLKLKALIALCLMLVSGFATSALVFHDPLIPVSSADSQPPFGLDGPVLSNASNSVSSLSIDLSTNYANDSIIVYAVSANTGPDLFLNVSDSNSLSWNERLNYTWSYGIHCFGTIGEFYAYSPSQLSSDTITVTQNVTDTLTINVFAVSGANPYPFDDGNDSANPAYSMGASLIPQVTLDNTTNPSDIVFGFLAAAGDPGKYAGSGFTRLALTHVAPSTAVENETLSSLENNFNVNYSLSASGNWTVLADAIEPLDALTPLVNHVVLIPMENVNESSILGISSLGPYDSYLRQLATDKAPNIGTVHIKSGSFTDYYGVMFPSTPNYIALTSGGTQGYPTIGTWWGTGGPYVCTSTNGIKQCPDIPANGWNVSSTHASLFSSIAKSTVYAESAPSDCSIQEDTLKSSNTLFNTQYVGHHTAYPYFLNSAGKYCLGIPGDSVDGVGYDTANGYDYATATISSGQFYENVTKGTLPAFSMLVPDICNDMHTCATQSGVYNYENGSEGCKNSYNTAQCELVAGDNFTKATIRLLATSSLWTSTLVIIVWDTGNCLAYYDHGGLGCSTSITHKNGGGNAAIIFASGSSKFIWTKESVTKIGTKGTIYNHYCTANTIVKALGVANDIGNGAHEASTCNYVSTIL